MAEAQQNPLINLINISALRNPQGALRYQQQQALAQQLMAQGDKEIDPLRAAAGGVAVPISPLEYLSKAANKGIGGYLQGKNNAMLANVISPQSPNPQALLSSATNAAIGSGKGQATQDQVAQKLGQALQSQTSNSFLPPGMDIITAMQISALPSEALQKAALDHWIMTPEQKNYQDPNTRGNVLAGQFVKTDGGGMVPASSLMDTFRSPQNMNPMLPNLIQQESGGNPNAVSPAGAQGIGQIMPATAAQPGYGVQPLQGMTNGNPATASVPEQLRFSNDYLNAMQAHNGGDPRLAAASYNAGPGRVDAALAQLPPETQAYVPKVAGNAQQSAYTSPTIQQRNDPNYMKQVGANVTKQGENQAEAFKNQQETQGKTNLMTQNSNQLIGIADKLLQDHPILANSTALLHGAQKYQQDAPWANKDIDTGITALKQLSSSNLLPSIKQFLQGTGQVRVFEGVNLDKIFSYEDDISLPANIAKWRNGIQQIEMGQQGADNLKKALDTGQIQKSTTPITNNNPSQPSGLNWIRQNGKLVQQ